MRLLRLGEQRSASADGERVRAACRQTTVRTRQALVAGLLVAVSACGVATDSSEGATGVRGVVLAGPQCPVETLASPCPDRPLPQVPVRISNEAGEQVGEVPTDERGRFSLSVPPGSYVVEAIVGPSGPTFAEPVRVTVGEVGFVEVTVHVDTGIR